MSTGGPTLTVELRGGFANQLFQWGVARRLADSHGAQVAWDARMVSRPASRGDRLSEIGLIDGARRPSRLSAALWRAAHRITPARAFPHLDALLRVRASSAVTTDVDAAAAALAEGRSITLRGYAQRIDVLQSGRDGLGAELRRGIAPHFSRELLPERYAAVHVRRGDYVADPLVARRFGTPSIDFYRAAVAEFAAPVVIVSDDPSWCREVLLPAVGPAVIHEGSSLYEDFAVLLHAEAIAVSNSTFSWWAAFGGTARTVIAPRPWLDDPTEPDLALADWVRLDKRSGRRA